MKYWLRFLTALPTPGPPGFAAAAWIWLMMLPRMAAFCVAPSTPGAASTAAGAAAVVAPGVSTALPPSRGGGRAGAGAALEPGVRVGRTPSWKEPSVTTVGVLEE